MKRALVTGGCGFIGSNLTKKLVSEGWMVDVVDNLSGGTLKSLEGLKKRVLPSSSFIAPYYASLRGRDGQANTSPEIQLDRSVETVLVIQDDLASEGMLKHIQEKNYDVVFHQAAVQYAYNR